MRPRLSQRTTIAVVRRRIVLAGTAAIVVTSLALGTTACIFDKGDYKGGGRIGRAATAEQQKVGQQEDNTNLPGDDPTPTATSVILDAARAPDAL